MLLSFKKKKKYGLVEWLKWENAWPGMVIHIYDTKASRV
jgi:hypothetical protein